MNQNAIALRVLLVEDNENDAELVLRELTRAGYDVTHERVFTPDSLRLALTSQRWDIMISDHDLGAFDSLGAIRLRNEHAPELPFILVTGTLGEELAVGIMKAGAGDYVMKGNLARLAPTVERELEECVERGKHRDAQRALRESEAALQRAQSLAKLSHVVTGKQGEFISWSASLPAMLGLDPEQMPRDTREWLERVHPDDREELREKSKAAGIGGQQFSHEYRLMRADGDWVTIRQLMEPQPTDGARSTWFNTLQDISDQRRAEKESERLRLAMDLSPDSISIIDASSLKFIYVNDSFCRRMGRSRGELLAMGAHEVLPMSREEYRREYDRLIASDSKRSTSESHFDKSGGGKKWIELDRHALKTDSGWLIVTIGRDITARKNVERKNARLNRVYAVLSGINSLIVRVRDREELFKGACRIAVEAGGLSMAWIGIVDRPAGRVVPVAWEGVDEAYMKAIPLRLGGEKPADFTFVGLAVAGEKPEIVFDVANDSRILRKDEARSRGFRSMAALPLTVSGEVEGVLQLCSDEVGFFDDEEVKLLAELAGDISFALDHIKNAEKLDYVAYYDELTGLANRTLFLERVGQHLIEAKASGTMLAVLLMDIERFRSVNDALGRQAGDDLLRQFGKRLMEVNKRQAGRLARVGADVFGVMVYGIRSGEQMARRAEQRLVELFAEPIRIGEVEQRISGKFGIAMYPDDGDNAETLFRNAEAALEKAKATGEPYLFYTQEMTTRVAERLDLENRLRQALGKEEFVLHYQPKVDMETRRIVGLEALIRWQTPQGLVPPYKFIPMLEETGLILEVGAWALGEAARAHRKLTQLGSRPPKVAVNVSPVQMRRREFVAVVEKAILEGVAPTGIDLEITESLIMEDIEGNILKMKEIRGLGVSLAIDDFGTGYSSLAYLAKLPVQTLKIDRSFVNTMLEDPANMTLVQTIISLAHNLRLKVVAEGVETEDQAKMLRLLRCDQMQGYLFSKPLPFDQVKALIESNREAIPDER